MTGIGVDSIKFVAANTTTSRLWLDFIHMTRAITMGKIKRAKIDVSACCMPITKSNKFIGYIERLRRHMNHYGNGTDA